MFTSKKFLIFWYILKKISIQVDLRNLDKEKANGRPPQEIEGNEFNKKLKYEIFNRFKLRKNQENRNPQLLMLHTRTESIK